MKGDFTRNTFRKQDHYSRVLQQQGRVQLDADWNELNDILLHRARTTRYDVIGPACGPENDAGFEITAAGDQLLIGLGRYYVNGILVEFDSPDGQPVNFLDQVDFPTAVLPTTPGRYRAILDVWERHITALEEPYIREVALGGPDTATRAQVIAQVRLIPADQDEACDDFAPGPYPAAADARGLLSARSSIEEEDPDPCEVPPSAGYRRLENQLYRVEIHDGGAVGTATFKWSRENGSIVSHIESRDGDSLVIAPPGRDENLGFQSTDWIEITDDHNELAGTAGVLVQLASAVGNVLTVDPSTLDGAATLAAAVNSLDEASRKVRRWESPAETITTGSFVALEDGVEVQFEPPSDEFRSGDYWIIPARTNTGDVEWPRDESTNLPVPQPPRGIDHFLAPLALLTLTVNPQTEEQTWTLDDDCRCLFPPLSDLPDQTGCCCCTVTVGDGSYSSGEYSDIQEAINAALEEFGDSQVFEICLLPGLYQLSETIRIEGARLKISGCGEQTVVIAPAGDPALIAIRSEITLDGLTIRAAAAEGAVILGRCQESEVVNCIIENQPEAVVDDTVRPPEGEVVVRPGERPVAGRRAAAARSRRFGPVIEVVDEELAANRLSRYVEVELAARPAASLFFPALVILQCRNMIIYNNYFAGFPAVQIQARAGEIRHNKMTVGGIWVQDGSKLINVEDNLLFRGYGPGVLLGGIANADQFSLKGAGVEMVTIQRNQILLMGDSGVASATEIDNIAGLGDLEDIRIADNHIEGCGQLPISALDGEGVGGIVLKNGSQLRINDNIIRHNGAQRQAACGILVEESEEVSILDNAVEENGSADIRTAECTDFRARDDEAGETPLTLERIRFENLQDENGARWVIQSNVMGIGQGSGMRCQTGLRITLAEPSSQIDLLLIGSDAQLRAFDAAGNEILTQSSTPTNVQQARTVTLRQEGMVVVQIAPSDRLWLQQICFGGSTGYQAGIAALFVYGDDFRPPSEGSPLYTHEPGRAALIVQGNTVVTPAGQALWVVGAGEMSITDNDFVSRGEYTQPVPNEEGGDDDVEAFWLTVAQVGRCVSIINLGIAIELSNLLVTGSLAARPSYVAEVSLLGARNAGREVPSGLIQFNDNQSLFYGQAPEVRLVLPNSFVLSLDDISYQDNQIRSSVERGIQITDAMVIGATTRVSNNRFAETFTGAFSSLVSFGMMNTTLGNIATHCIFAFAQAGNIINAGNQIAIKFNCPDKSSGLAEAIPGMVIMDAANFAYAATGDRTNG
ncbi:MAG: DUF6519 domain-containing protein [Ardenticatenaceae bacterium]|nr:DUF6519 domain-containing protein [Ardenticatenaceae bacterium]